jgi:hypothetical protein
MCSILLSLLWVFSFFVLWSHHFCPPSLATRNLSTLSTSTLSTVITVNTPMNTLMFGTVVDRNSIYLWCLLIVGLLGVATQCGIQEKKKKKKIWWMGPFAKYNGRFVCGIDVPYPSSGQRHPPLSSLSSQLSPCRYLVGALMTTPPFLLYPINHHSDTVLYFK